MAITFVKELKMEFVDVLRDEYKGVVGYDLDQQEKGVDEPDEAVLIYKPEELFEPYQLVVYRTVYNRDITLRIKGSKTPIVKFVHKTSEDTELLSPISNELAGLLRDTISYSYICKGE